MTGDTSVMDIDLLIFDLDDTLVSWAQRVVVARQRVAELLSTRLPGSAGAWLKALEQRDGDLWEKVVNGDLLQEEVATIRMRRVVDSFNHDHSVDDVVAEAVQLQHSTMLEEARVDEAAHILLKSLRERYPLYLLTNGVATLQWPTIRRLDLEQYFDEILIGSELRSYKPRPEPFQEALSRAGLPPHRVCMIGNSWHDDVQGAGRLGIKTIWLNHEGSSVPDGELRADYEVKDLDELFTFFKLPQR